MFLDIFTLIAPLVTASLPTTVAPSRDFADMTCHPVARATEVYSLAPGRHFCRVMCPYCCGEHSHEVDLAEETGRHGFGPREAHCARLLYWIDTLEWEAESRRRRDCATARWL